MTDERLACLRDAPNETRVLIDFLTESGWRIEVISDLRAENERVARCRAWLRRKRGWAWAKIERARTTGGTFVRWVEFRAELSTLDEQTLWRCDVLFAESHHAALLEHIGRTRVEVRLNAEERARGQRIPPFYQRRDN